MNCPKCPGNLEPKTYGRKITVHRCKDCGGLFCKPEVLLEMRKEWMSEVVLDAGNPRMGKALDKVGDIHCPSCDVPMDKTADARQTHIWYETCSSCGSIFLDAGEFTDLKYDTFMDRVRGLVRGRRPVA